MPSLWPSLALVYMIVVCFVLCYWGWFKVLTWLPAGVAAYGLLLVPVIGGCTSPLARYEFAEIIMGVEARITLYAEDGDQARSARC